MTLDSAYWLFEALAMVVESHYEDFIEADLAYQKDLSEWARREIATIQTHALGLEGAAQTAYLTQQNQRIVDHYLTTTRDFLFELMTEGTELSKLTFKMDPNL